MKSKIYGIILAVILLGYGFFLFSPLIIHEEKVYLYTPIGTVQKLSEKISLQLENWLYSPNEKSMSVMFSIQNSEPGDISLNMAAKEEHTTHFLSMETGTESTRIPVRFIFPTSSLLIVLLDNIPQQFDGVTLMVQLSTSEEGKVNQIVPFYTTAHQVERVETIDYKNTNYRIEYLTLQKQEKQQEIKKLLEANKKFEEKNEEYQKEIDKLIADQEYETKEEIEMTNNKIKSYRQMISSNNEAVTQNKYTIEELKNSIRSIDELIEKQKQKDAEKKSTEEKSV